MIERLVQLILTDQELISKLQELFLKFLEKVQDSVPNFLYPLYCSLTNKEFLDTIFKFLYYLLCYKGTQNQTPGEEYALVNKSRTSFLFILAKAILPVIFNRLVMKIINLIKRNKSFTNIEITSSEVDEAFKDLEFAMFLLLPSHYEGFSELLFRSEYSSKTPNDKTSDDILDPFVYRVLSLSTLFTLGYKIIRKFWVFIKKSKEINKTSISRLLKLKSTIVEEKTKNSLNKINSCLICMDNISSPSSTFCGHIFCWNCVIEYIQQSNKCPTCRTPLKANQVICINLT